jgi:hypothetical protein
VWRFSGCWRRRRRRRRRGRDGARTRVLAAAEGVVARLPRVLDDEAERLGVGVAEREARVRLDRAALRGVDQHRGAAPERRGAGAAARGRCPRRVDSVGPAIDRA